MEAELRHLRFRLNDEEFYDFCFPVKMCYLAWKLTQPNCIFNDSFFRFSIVSLSAGLQTMKESVACFSVSLLTTLYQRADLDGYEYTVLLGSLFASTYRFVRVPRSEIPPRTDEGSPQ